ncbi:MAG: phosphate ABC transporter permease PstA [Corynebacterium sp.]|nr:phosphate ABC transporter permease PstA [Corynebacterium sp.]
MNTVSPSQEAVKKTSTFSGISSSRKTTNTAATFIIYLCMLLAVVPLVWVLWELITKGLPPVLHLDWWTDDMLGVRYAQPGGGALHAIVGTLVQAFFASVIAIPIGIFTAIYLVEYSKGGWLGRITTFMVDILSGVPSIVAALFVYAAWITVLGFDRSGLAVAWSLLLLMIPIVVRNTEEMLRVVPMDLREASYALGVPKWKTIAKIVLPTALSGIATGIMLAIARIMGESAPVLILVGTTPALKWDPSSGPMSSLPLMMLDMFKAGLNQNVLDKMWGAAFTLVLLIAILNIGARVISAKFSIKQ